MISCELETDCSSHAQTANVDFLLLFLLPDYVLYEILSLLDNFGRRTYVSPLITCRATEVFIVQGIDVGLAFFGDPHGEVARSVRMGVQSREEENDRLRWLDWVQVVVIVQLVSLMLPFVMQGIVFSIKNILSF